MAKPWEPRGEALGEVGPTLPTVGDQLKNLEACGMDREWALSYLRDTIAMIDSRSQAPDWSGTEKELTARIPTLMKVVRRAAPESLATFQRGRGMRLWNLIRDAVTQTIYAVEHEDLLEEKLGPPPSPQLNADQLHSTVWDPAKSLWRSNHRRQAVQAAAVSVNAALQDRIGRRDVSESKAMQQAFTTDKPKEGQPRLRLMEADGSDTYQSLHDGAIAFGTGCFKALRNPPAHDPHDELEEQKALEQLAAFSILARWIEDAELDDAIRLEDLE